MKKNLPRVEDIDVSGKNVLVRVDLDVSDLDNPRIKSASAIVSYLLDHGAARVRALGHKGDIDVVTELGQRFPGVEWKDTVRDDPREMTNDLTYAQELAHGWDIYVNEAFAVSHRIHTSMVALPEVMKQQGKSAVMGLQMEKEMEMLAPVLDRNGKKVLVVGGTKVKDKMKYALGLAPVMEKVLAGGLLPHEINKLTTIPANFVTAVLRDDGFDINEDTIRKFEEEIGRAEVLIAAGVMGKYEDEASEEGTKRVLNAVAHSPAYKVAGGGDIEAAISHYGLESYFDWISVGGGAMLEFLVSGTLPALDALK